ncbi:MAG: methyltransferase domain-containing protein [Bryobacteraceae bacterium]|nr:methyltransferase domain-containing protein [Bryobacteraceae bacterium]
MKLVFVLAALGATLSAQVAREANAGYRDEDSRKRVATTLGDEGRDVRQKPAELIKRLDIRQGMSVADIGTAVGYMLPHLSKAVGPAGTVWAEDIFPDFLKQAKERNTALSNVRYVEGNEKSVELPSGSIDRALILDAYHHFDFPKQMLDSIAKALRPGGQLAIVEYEKNEKSMSGGRALQHIRLTRAEFVREIEGYGLKAISVTDFIPEVQWIGIFEKR